MYGRHDPQRDVERCPKSHTVQRPHLKSEKNNWKTSMAQDLDILSYTEKTVGDTVGILRRSYDDLHERLQKLITALVGGAGAVAGFSLSRYADAASWLPRYTLCALAGTWFVIAAAAMLRGGISRKLSPGNGPAHITRYHDETLRFLESSGVAEAKAEALLRTRQEELRLQQERINMYREASDERARTIDGAYKAVALSWLVPLLVYALGVHSR
jgi:hypothetical protein